jgi:hypothetical protein
MEFEAIYSPKGLARTNVPSVDVGVHLIYLCEIKDGPVLALCDVLVQILHTLRRMDNLHVDVCVVSVRKDWIIWHHPRIVKIEEVWVGFVSQVDAVYFSAIFRAPSLISWVVVRRELCFM